MSELRLVGDIAVFCCRHWPHATSSFTGVVVVDVVGLLVALVVVVVQQREENKKEEEGGERVTPSHLLLPAVCLVVSAEDADGIGCYCSSPGEEDTKREGEGRERGRSRGGQRLLASPKLLLVRRSSPAGGV